VTIPPLQMSSKVAAAVNQINRFNHLDERSACIPKT
jgi:hypothetical protein